jgi:cell division protein FtsL
LFSGIVIYFKIEKEFNMDTKQEEANNPEPPELRKQGIPPLKKQMKIVYVIIAVAFVIVLIFALIFWFSNNR